MILCIVSCETDKIRKTIINGVTFVRNPNKPRDIEFSIVPQKKFSVKNIVFRERQEGSINQYLVVDSTKNIFIYNKNDNKIRKYNNNGELVIEFGGLGFGPGEISSANNLSIHNDTIRVLIMQERKYNYYNLDGKFLECKKVDDNITSEHLPDKFDEKIKYYYCNYTEMSSNSILRYIRYFNDQYVGKELSVINYVDKGSIKFKKVKLYDEFVKRNFDKYAMEFLKHFYNNGKIYYAENDKNNFRYHVFNSSGKELLVVSKNYRKVKYPKYFIAKMKVLEGVFMPESFKYVQPITDIKSDKYGNVWIKSGEDCHRQKYMNYYQIFNSEGIYTNKIDLSKLTSCTYIKEVSFKDEFMFVYGDDGESDELHVFSY